MFLAFICVYKQHFNGLYLRLLGSFDLIFRSVVVVVYILVVHILVVHILVVVFLYVQHLYVQFLYTAGLADPVGYWYCIHATMRQRKSFGSLHLGKVDTWYCVGQPLPTKYFAKYFGIAKYVTSLHL